MVLYSSLSSRSANVLYTVSLLQDRMKPGTLYFEYIQLCIENINICRTLNNHCTGLLDSVTLIRKQHNFALLLKKTKQYFS